MESLLGTLRAAGFSAELTYRAYHVLDSYVVGFTLWQVTMDLPADTADLAALGADFLRELPTAQFPFVAEHVQQHLRPTAPEAGSDFAFGLDLILDGLERLRSPASPDGPGQH
jgi:hypothetical protein